MLSQHAWWQGWIYLGSEKRDKSTWQRKGEKIHKGHLCGAKTELLAETWGLGELMISLCCQHHHSQASKVTRENKWISLTMIFFFLNGLLPVPVSCNTVSETKVWRSWWYPDLIEPFGIPESGLSIPHTKYLFVFFIRCVEKRIPDKMVGFHSVLCARHFWIAMSLQYQAQWCTPDVRMSQNLAGCPLGCSSMAEAWENSLLAKSWNHGLCV